MRKENRDIMRKTGIVFFLNAPFRDIWRRISTDKNRPIVQKLTFSELEKLFNDRKPHYIQSAHFKVETENRSLKNIVDYIAFQIGRLKGNM